MWFIGLILLTAFVFFVLPFTATYLVSKSVMKNNYRKVQRGYKPVNIHKSKNTNKRRF